MGAEEKKPFRPQVDLGGTWELAFDRSLRGLEDGWQMGGWPEGAGSPIQVPGIWNLTFPGMEGVGFCRTAFACRSEWTGKAVYLYFEGVSYYFQAWVNGQYIGSHEGAYTPASFDITTHIEPAGENILVVRVASLAKDRAVDGRVLAESPASKQSWYATFGGIWGRVYLEARPQVSIQQVRVIPDLQRERIEVNLRTQSHLSAGQLLEVNLEVLAPDGEKAAGCHNRTSFPAGAADYAFTLPIRHPQAWSPEAPNLYRLIVKLASPEGETDCLETRFGMRDFSVREGQFYLNGEPICLRGVLLQPDYPKTIAAPPDPSMIEQDLRLAKEAGFNLLRVHIRPAAPGLLDLADELGLLIYAEASLAWIKNSPRLTAHGKRELSELIHLEYNHPSVVFWGIYNENPPASAINGLELVQYARSLDPTRVIVQNSGGSLAIDQDFGWIDRAAWLPERQAQPEKAIDIHLYLGGILPRSVRQWLGRLGSSDNPSTCLVDHRLGNKPTLEEFDRELRGFRGKIFLSELGCGGITDLDAAAAGYAGDVQSEDGSLLRRLRDELQQGFFERGLDQVFGSVGNLVVQAQALQAAAETSQLEAVLLNPRFSGFGVTQLCDLSWECHAGLLDVWRHPKPAYHALKRLNQPHCLVIEPGCAAIAAGESVAVSLARVSRAGLPPGVQIQAWSENALGDRLQTFAFPAGSQPGIHHFAESSFTFEQPGQHRIAACLIAPDDLSVETSSPLLVLNPDHPDRWRDRWVSVGMEAGLFNDHFIFSQPSSWQDADRPLLIAAPGSLAAFDWEKILERIQMGQTALVGPLQPGDHLAMAALGRLGVNIGLMPGIGSWNGCYHWIPPNRLFAGLPSGCIAGAEYVDILPHDVLAELGGEVYAGCFTTTTNPRAEKHVLWRSDIESIPAGKGRLIFCQYRVFSQGPGHPVAMQLASNLLKMALE